MEEDTSCGCIYILTCTTNNKSYVGQASFHKFKDERPYRYGMWGRWSDHKSTAKMGGGTPLSQAIREFGHEAFLLTQLGAGHRDTLDAWEAHYIEQYNTMLPNGYNVAKHSRVRHRDATNISQFYLSKTSAIEVKPLHEAGEKRAIYCYLSIPGQPERTRLSFGRGMNASFEEAWEDTSEFLLPFYSLGIPIQIAPTLFSDDPMDKYTDKIAKFHNKQITRIRITESNRGRFVLIMLNISTADEPGWKNVKHIAFGGATIPTNTAYQIACLFIERLPIDQNTEIIDLVGQNTNKFNIIVSNRQPPVRLEMPAQMPAITFVIVPDGENGVNFPGQPHITA
jgi:hypothetical protein